MARPKLNGPKKQSLHITVRGEVKDILNQISEKKGLSISSLIEAWAMEEAKNLYKVPYTSDNHTKLL